MRKLIFIFMFFSLGFLASCSSFYDKKLGVTIDVMYAEALHNFSEGDLNSAKTIFENIADQYPFSDEAIEANIFLIWIYYIKDDLVSLEITVDSFLRYYVYNQYTPWVTYMSAVARYEQMYDTDRDQTYTKDALVAFSNIISKGTLDKKYLKDAEYKLQVIKYNLAKKDIEVAYYYLEHKKYVAALKRYKNIVNYYSNTDFIKEALYREAYIWLVLGVKKEAYRVVSTLGYNYPDSKWYALSLDLLKKYAPEYSKDKKELYTNRIAQ